MIEARQRFVAAACLGLAASAGNAADEREPGEVPLFYETATVQARAVANATATVSIVEREEILASGASSAGIATADAQRL